MILILTALFLSSANSFAKDILLVGDSLTCGPFGGAVVRSLAKDPQNNVTVYCAVGARPGDWINGNLPVRTADKVTKLPTSYYPCKTCTGKSCADWYSPDPLKYKNSVPDENFLSDCNKADAGKGPVLAEMLNKKPPYDKVIVALGTNTLSRSDKADSSYKQTLDLIGKSGTESCDWIGPPHFD